MKQGLSLLLGAVNRATGGRAWGRPREQLREVARRAGERTPEIAKALEAIKDVRSPAIMAQIAEQLLEGGLPEPPLDRVALELRNLQKDAELHLKVFGEVDPGLQARIDQLAAE